MCFKDPAVLVDWWKVELACQQVYLHAPKENDCKCWWCNFGLHPSYWTAAWWRGEKMEDRLSPGYYAEWWNILKLWCRATYILINIYCITMHCLESCSWPFICKRRYKYDCSIAHSYFDFVKHGKGIRQSENDAYLDYLILSRFLIHSSDSGFQNPKDLEFLEFSCRSNRILVFGWTTWSLCSLHWVAYVLELLLDYLSERVRQYQ